MFSSNSPPDTSLTMCAPAAIADRATSAWKVSTAISTSRNASSVASALQPRHSHATQSSGSAEHAARLRRVLDARMLHFSCAAASGSTLRGRCSLKKQPTVSVCRYLTALIQCPQCSPKAKCQDSRYDGHDTLELHFGRQACGVGAGALAANVDNVDTGINHIPRPPDGRLHLQLRMGF